MEVDSPQTNNPVMQSLPDGYFLLEPQEIVGVLFR
jgi:hypothetical protein